MHVYTELPLMLRRLRGSRVRRQFRSADNLLVNLGAGPEGKPGWVNVDGLKQPNVNCLYDCRKDLPFPNESVRGIFCEHFFEHIDYTEDVPGFLSECRRVLKKGGVLRLIVPDAEKYMRAYCKGGWEDLVSLRQLSADHADFFGKYNTRIELINFVFRQGHEHHFAYDAETLEFVLTRHGFSEVAHQEYGKSLMSELCLDQACRASESLYVDARK